MMSLATIRALSDQVGAEAEEAGKVPYVIVSEYERNENACRHIPNIGSYEPDRWVEVDRLFVDKSGFGQPGEPALTIEQFVERLRVGYGYAIVEEGQFQIYIAEFRPPVEERIDGVDYDEEV